MVDLIRVLVDVLRQKCLEEKSIAERPPGGGLARGNSGVQGRSEDGDAGSKPGSYSALTQAPNEWRRVDGQPCSGERLLLMFDRWRKLLKAVYNEKKQQFDISKVPDIYDAVKYDAIHNAHLGLDLEDLYTTAKSLADTVIPNEYGLTPDARLHIGSSICSQLLGKILADMHNMKEESLATAGINEQDPNLNATADGQGIADAADGVYREAGDLDGQGSALHRTDTNVSGVNGAEVEDGDDQVLHRLCPAYAQDVNSPLRHVRTRIYYTSESHMHSLLNVLRFCHLGGGSTHRGSAPITPEGSLSGGPLPSNSPNGGTAHPTPSKGIDAAMEGLGLGDSLPEGAPVPMSGPAPGLLSQDAQGMLDKTTELDYQTQIVFRMFENKRVGVDHPERFRVELWFSPGANHNPFELVPLADDHTLPMRPRSPLHPGSGICWSAFSKLLKPYAARVKASTYPSTWRQGQGSMASFASGDGGRSSRS